MGEPQQSATRDAIATAFSAWMSDDTHPAVPFYAADAVMPFVDAARAEGYAAALTDAARVIEAREANVRARGLGSDSNATECLTLQWVLREVARLGEERQAP